jgi:N-acetyl-gamma-glutamyl-phosphate reductase
MKIGIVGGTGYAGIQLIALLKNHPDVTIEFIASRSQADQQYGHAFHRFDQSIDQLMISPQQALEQLNKIDLLFLTLPHTVSMSFVKEAIKKNKTLKIIDFSGDYRFDQVALYEQYYEVEHKNKINLNKFIYGLPEINREAIASSLYIANPGCYPTSIILPLYPLLQKNLIQTDSIIVDSKSGVSGAGKKANTNFLYTEINDSCYGYKAGVHRHQPEIIEKLGGNVNLLFSPHIIPSTRGILSTIYCDLNESTTDGAIVDELKQFYKNEPFVNYVDFIPKTTDVTRTNNCFIHAQYDQQSNKLIIYSVIDNLMKGASSQAIQNMNILLELDETTGLTINNFYL